MDFLKLETEILAIPAILLTKSIIIFLMNMFTWGKFPSPSNTDDASGEKMKKD